MNLISAERQLNALAEMYKESTRRHREQLRERHRWEWIRFFDTMAENHAALSEDYRRRADDLILDQGGGGLT